MDDRSEIASNAATFFSYLSNNFVVISAAVTITIAGMVTTFIYSYLSVFDSSLVWIVESTDLVKYCVIGFALATGYIFSLYVVIDIFMKWEKLSTGTKIAVFGIMGFILILSLILDIYQDITSNNSRIEFHIYKYLAFFIMLGFAALAFMFIEMCREVDFYLINGALVILVGVFLVIGSWAMGRTYGLWLRDVSTEKHVILVRSENGYFDEILDAKIVVITANHTVIRERNNNILLPSTAIARITLTEASK
ncbi:hypothetical protein [Methylocystis rosea]|uniref:hypothetical protein n=1 Tax=Methylocystis rosea TaxID=173366 RepID=UPI00037C0765|nr:hypothetical protein [Methylocystis rosea]